MLGLGDSPFAFKVHRVASGTKIKDPASGDQLEVTETSAVFSRHACWVTDRQYEDIIAKTESTTDQLIRARNRKAK